MNIKKQRQHRYDNWGWLRVETPEASSYSWCLQSH